MNRRLALPLLVALLAAAVLWSTVRSRGGSEPAAPAALTGQRGAQAASFELARAAPAHSARSSVPSGAPVVAPAAEAALIVDVWTRTPGFGASRQSVPSVPFVVGVGAPLDPAVRPLTRAVSDADGRARVTIPWSAVEAVRESPGAAVWARVTGQGLRARTKWTELPPAPEVLDLALLVSPGGTVRGRLLAGGDEPVPGKVRLHTWADPGRLRFRSAGDAGEDGWFEVHLAHAGEYQVRADAGVYGTGVLRDLDVRFGSAVESLQVHVRGPGVVRGRVRDAEGQPAAMLHALVLLAALDNERGDLGALGPQAIERGLEGRGRIWARFRTGPDGTFEVRGLREDTYVVRARTDEPQGGYPILLTAAPVAADGTQLELSLARPHLIVRIVNEDGSPWIKFVSDAAPGFLGRGWPSYWPRKRHLIAIPVGGAGQPGDQPAYAPGHRGPSGEIVFEVADGRRYLVGLLGGAVQWRPVEVSIPEGATRVEVTVTGVESAATGALLVTAVDWAGAAVEGGLAIRVEDPSTGMPLLVDPKRYPSPWPYRLELPAGRYRLVVEGAASLYEGTMLLAERGHGRFATTVTILDGQDTTVLATLPKGARLRVRLAGDVRAEDREAVRKYDHRSEQIEDWAARTSLALFADGRWAEPILFRRAWTDGTSAGTSLASELALNSEQTSELLPAGRFRVEARLPGGRVVSRSVVLVDGETTEVDLSFE